MSARAGVTWTGLDELGRELRALPEVLQREADRITREAAQAHLAEVRQVFPEKDKTGNLRRGNRLEVRGPMKYVVRNAAPHSHLYEDGYDHVSGRRVAGHDVFVPAAAGIRARMLDRLRGLLTDVATRSGRMRAA
jgi:hypothetical protein